MVVVSSVAAPTMARPLALPPPAQVCGAAWCVGALRPPAPPGAQARVSQGEGEWAAGPHLLPASVCVRERESGGGMGESCGGTS